MGSKVLFVQLSDDRRKVKHVEDFMTGFVRGNVACGKALQDIAPLTASSYCVLCRDPG